MNCPRCSTENYSVGMIKDYETNDSIMWLCRICGYKEKESKELPPPFYNSGGDVSSS